MIVYEAKLEGTKGQFGKLDEAIRTGRFVRNSIIRAWLDKEIKSRNDAYKYCKILADKPEFPWAKKLNSMARQAHAERAWASIEQFYRNCKAKIKGKKGFPKFAKYKIRASVEYKTSGYKLSECRRYLKFTDGFKAGSFKLWGSRDLHFYQLNQIKRVRVVRRHDGYYAQFLIDVDRRVDKELTGVQRGLDVGLNHFYTDNFGEKIENTRFLKKDERKLKKLQRRLSRTQKNSKNRVKARNKLGRAHLKVSRRRNDWVCKLAQRAIQSSDLVAIENLRVRYMVKNHKLAKSINDAAWYRFREWLEYFGSVYGVPVIVVNPNYTSINCSNCGKQVVKTLSTRTHFCNACFYVADRDENAAKNILKSAMQQLSDTVNGASHHFKLSDKLTKQLKELAQSSGATFYTILLATFQVLLYRYTGQEDIMVGSPTSGRSKLEFAPICGYFVDPVVMRANLSGNPSFQDFLTQVRHTVLEALAHQDYPFALLVEKLQPTFRTSKCNIKQSR